MIRYANYRASKSTNKADIAKFKTQADQLELNLDTNIGFFEWTDSIGE